MEVTKTEQKKEKIIFKNEDSLRGLWNNITHTKIHITEVPEGKKRERQRGAGEIITEKLPNLGNKTDIQVQKAQIVPNKVNPKEVHTKTH